VLALLATGIVASLVVVTAGAAAAQTKPAASNSAITGAIRNALKVKAISLAHPYQLTPNYLDIVQDDPNTLQGTSLLKANCNPYSFPKEVANPQPCIYGSTSASRTIVIFGDSYVGNWIPALNIVGKSMGYRIAAYEFAGCITPFVPASGSPTPSSQECLQWHTNLPAAVQSQHPVAILAANGTPSWGPQGDPGWVQGIATAFNEMTANSPSTIRILLGTGPHFSHPIPACLAAYPQAIQKCTLTYKPGVVGANQYGAALTRDQQGATAANAKLIPTVQWFCLNDHCPAIINNLLVYADADHVSIVYSQYLATVLQQALTPLLS
jgi:hypothetical protein